MLTETPIKYKVNMVISNNMFACECAYSGRFVVETLFFAYFAGYCINTPTVVSLKVLFQRKPLFGVDTLEFSK